MLRALVVALVCLASVALALHNPFGHPGMRDWKRHMRRWQATDPALRRNARHRRHHTASAADRDAPHKPMPVGDIPAALDAFISGVFACFELPGLTVSVVSPSRGFAYARGFGTRTVGANNTPVDPTTLFGIGSTSKAFTATALAAAVDSGLLNFTDPVARWLPAFTMHDAWANASVTLKDLMSHRTGVPRYDTVWASGVAETRLQGVLNVGQLVPQYQFRDQYLYNNWMWSTAGTVLETASGLPWAEYIESRLFAPLGMTQSTTNVSAAIATGNYAAPNVYQPATQQYAPLPIDTNRFLDVIGPAGCISSNALDMAQWMALHLGNGTTPGGHTVASAATLATTKTPVVTLDAGFYLPWSPVAVTDTGYAFGWVTGSYRGYRMYWHNGGTLGHTTLLSFLPDADVAVFASVNGIGGSEEMVETFVTDYAFDLLLGATPFYSVAGCCAMKPHADAELQKPRAQVAAEAAAAAAEEGRVSLAADEFADPRAGWTAEQRAFANVLSAAGSERVAAAVQPPSPSPYSAADPSPWAGTYTSPWAGQLTVAADGVTVTLNQAPATLVARPQQPNLYWLEPAGWFATLNPGPDVAYPFVFVTHNGVRMAGVVFDATEAPYVFAATSADDAAEVIADT